MAVWLQSTSAVPLVLGLSLFAIFSARHAGEAGADMAALAYVRRMRRMNLTGKATAGQPVAAASSLGDGLGATWGLNWADKTFGQGLSSLTKGA